MTGKYLPLKFGFVALLVILCVLSLFWGKGLKKGPDIAGGHSMIFEVVNDEGRADLIERVISVLKKRIDPTGLSSLEWRPLKNNRFEVRMPAASDESTALRNGYLQARDALLSRNIELSEIRMLLSLPGEKRAEKIAELTGKDDARAKRLEAMLVSMDALHQADAKLKDIDKNIAEAKNPSPAQLAEFQTQRNAAMAASDQANVAYREYLEKLRNTNINPRQLQGLMKLYDDVRDQTGSDARRAAKELYRSRLEEFENQYPAWKEDIVGVASMYERWSDIRRGLEDPSDLIRLIRKAGVLEFRIAPENPQYNGPLTEAQIQKFSQSLMTDGPEALRDAGGEYAWYPLHGETEGYDRLITNDFAGQRYLLLSNKSGECLVRASGDDERWKLASATIGNDEYGAPAVNFSFDETGAKLFSQLTAANKSREMAILLDDEVYSAPTIQSVISNNGQITGKFTYEEVDELVRTLEAGSLPGRVNPDPVSQNTFSPALGQVAIQKAFRSGVIGVIAVAGFMLLYYLVGGAIADVALLLNIILVLGAMSMFEAVLTLPGIAGVILTMGMAVDANVLIFERLREEQNRGLNVRQALKNAYERAFSAIIDSNLTTLLICLFLFLVFKWVGMEEVRGFAITLGLGVTFSMFTALVVTRWIFLALLDLKVITKPIPMLRLVPKINFNWMGKRHIFWAISLLLMVMGVVSLYWQKGSILGIEFSSGTQAMLKLQDDALVENRLPNDGLVRSALIAQAEKEAAQAGDEAEKKIAQDFVATARVETVINANRVEEFLKLYGDAAGNVTMDSWAARKKDGRFFELIDTNRSGVLEKAELDAKLPETMYQISTTVTDVKLVRGTADGAFGEALQRRVPCTYEFAKGKEIPQMGVRLAPTDSTRIVGNVLTGVAPAYRDDMLDFDDGILFVIENVTPPLSVGQLQERIRDIRLQPDFGPWAVNPYKVMGVTRADDGDYSAFAVLVRPADPEQLQTPGGLARFLEGEQDVLNNALIREDPIVVVSFDAAIAGETAQLAVVVIIMSWLAIVAYLWLRFGSVQWGLAAVLCLVHDVIIVVGLVAASGWLFNTAVGRALGLASFKIDLAMVAALLTVIGYSVNDTIVVFDRIRENRGKLKTVTGECINTSINQTLSRTLLTSFTTFLVVFIMYVWGGPGIKAFNFALMMGIIIGTYSSIAIASPLLLGFKQAVIAKVTGSTGDEPAES